MVSSIQAVGVTGVHIYKERAQCRKVWFPFINWIAQHLDQEVEKVAK